jgi:hypothetical protein
MFQEQDNVYIPSFMRDAQEQPREALGSPLGPQPDLYVPTFMREQEQPVQAVQSNTEASESYIPTFMREEQDNLYIPTFMEEQQQSEFGSRRADEIRGSVGDMAAIRQYMIARKGAQYRDIDDEELYDDFINHMRFFNVNEVTTLGELRWLRSQEQEQVEMAGQAYQVFDSLGSLFTNDGVLGAIDGVADYTRAVLTSPSTYLGLGVGRIVAGGATRAAVQAAKGEAIEAAIAAATRGLTGQAAREAGERAASQTITQLSRTTALNQIGIATLVDAGANSFQDYLYQTTLMEAGAQQEYSMFQTSIAALGGFVGGAVATAPYLVRGFGSDASTRIRAASEQAQREAQERFQPAVERAIERFQANMADWVQSVRNGERLSGDSIEVQERAVRMLLDPEQSTSIPYAMREAGLFLRTGREAPGAVHQMVSYAKSLPAERMAELDRSFKETTGLAYSELIDIIAAAESRAGQILGIGSKAAREIAKVNAARARADNIIVENMLDLGAKLVSRQEQEALPPDRQTMQYIQSLWRRALVSHPATTAINIQGWAQATAARALAETLHGGILGVAGLAAKMAAPISGRAASFSDAALRQSQLLFQAQTYKLSNFVAPYETRETFEALLDQMPKYLQERLNRDAFGGVSMQTAARYGLNPENLVLRRIETMSSKAAAWSGVKVQDVYTKSFSMLGELDRLLKEKMSQNLEQVISSGRLQDIPDEIWERAVEVALRDTFSADFTKTSGIFGGFSKFIEQLSNIPVVGFLFPFGRFLNNNLAFIMQYSPVGFWPFIVGANNRGFFQGTTRMESFAKAMVGTSALAGLALYQRSKQERGLQWYEEETSTGDRINRQNLAPGSFYMLAGHVADLALRGESVSTDLRRDLVAQVGLDRLTRDLGSNTALDEAIGYMTTIFDEEAPKQEFFGIMTEMARMALGDIGSGFTRPLEPLNVAVGAVRGTDTITDQRLVRGPEAVARGFFRYLDNILNLAGVEEGPARQDISRAGPVSDPNPVGRMLGDRYSPTVTDIDLLLARANISPWTANERTGIPEWDTIMNEVVTPLLNNRARELMDTPIYQNANQRTRERLTRTLLTEVKREVRTALGEQGSPNQVLRREQSRFLSLPESLRLQGKAAFGWRDIDDRDLTLYQIEILRIWIEDRREFEQYLTRR